MVYYQKGQGMAEQSLAIQRLHKNNEQAKQWRKDMALLPTMGKNGKLHWKPLFTSKNGQEMSRADKGNSAFRPMAKTEAIKSKRIILEKKRPFHKVVKQKQATRVVGESERWNQQLAIFHSKKENQ